MAESSIFWTTGGAGDGASAYTMAQITAWLRRTLGSGIHIGYANAFAPTGAAPNVNIDTGSACVHGYPYENTASVAVNIPTPAGATRIDRIVLRASWAAQTVRITRIAGVEGDPAPAITQNDGVTWDEMICQVSITTGGVITVTDERTYLAPYGQVLLARLIDGIFTADAAGRAKFAAGFLGADATSRALIATDFFDIATVLSKFATDSWTNATLLQLIHDGSFAADAATRALFADGLMTNAKQAADAKRLKGTVIMWSGTMGAGADAHYPVDPDTAAVNKNWHLCNGDIEGGVTTPNLADKFVIAAGATYAAGATGGAATKNLAHTHGIGSYAAANESTHKHGYGDVVLAAAANHTHTVVITSDASGSAWSSFNAAGASNLVDASHTHLVNGNTGNAGNHNHAWFSGSSASGDAHTHALAGSSASGGSAVQDIMPPYYSLVYLCYVGGV